MTIVIGKRFDQEICMVADTMISDEESGNDSAIPGRLKIITLSPNFTVGYAGHANQALDAIREAHTVLRSDGFDNAIERLRAASADQNHDVDFLVACHRPAAELRRIWEGRISGPLTESAIGQAAIVTKIDERFIQAGNPREDSKNFRLAFIRAFSSRRDPLGDGVGGFPTALHAVHDNHAYKAHSSSHNWKPIKPVWGGTIYEDENELLTGEWSFRHDLMTIQKPGLAILGVEVLQAKIGFVYAPLLEDDARPVKLLEHEGAYTQHQKEMHATMRRAVDQMLQEHEKRFA